MATREYGFMGEKFPSKKFQRKIAEFLEHIGVDQKQIAAEEVVKCFKDAYAKRSETLCFEGGVLQTYQDLTNDYQRRVDMAEIKLKNSIPVWSPSYDEAIEENKALKAKCEALEEREQVIIDAIIECFGRRPLILDDVIQLSGDSYNEMVRKINKLRITE